MQQPALLSRAQAAKYLGVGISTVRRLVGTGELREIKLGKRSLLSLSELDRFIGFKQAQADARVAEALALEHKLAS